MWCAEENDAVCGNEDAMVVAQIVCSPRRRVRESLSVLLTSTLLELTICSDEYEITYAFYNNASKRVTKKDNRSFRGPFELSICCEFCH